MLTSEALNGLDLISPFSWGVFRIVRLSSYCMLYPNYNKHQTLWITLTVLFLQLKLLILCPKREQIASVITGKNKLRAWSDRTDELGCTPAVCKSVSNKEHVLTVLDYFIKLKWIINWEVSGWIVHKNYSFNVIISPKTCFLRYLPFSPKNLIFNLIKGFTAWQKLKNSLTNLII